MMVGFIVKWRREGDFYVSIDLSMRRRIMILSYGVDDEAQYTR